MGVCLHVCVGYVCACAHGVCTCMCKDGKTRQNACFHIYHSFIVSDVSSGSECSGSIMRPGDGRDVEGMTTFMLYLE